MKLEIVEERGGCKIGEDGREEIRRLGRRGSYVRLREKREI